MTATRSKEAERRASLGTRVTIETPCETCNCEGHYLDPEWAEFGRKLEQAERQAERELGAGRYERRAEVTARAEVILKENSVVEPTGPEEPACGECEGKGRITKDVTVAELARLIDVANGLCPSCRVPNEGIHICTGRGSA